MSRIIFCLSPIVGLTVAYFAPLVGLQVIAIGMCAGVFAMATSTANEMQRVKAVPVVRYVPGGYARAAAASAVR